MALNLNKVFLLGNLTFDPETRYTQSGAQVTTFRIAVNERRGGQENTMFIKVETWNKTAEIAGQYLQKGSEVLVEGRLKIDEYETRDGEKRRDAVVKADRIELGRRPRDGQGGGPSGGGGGAPRSRESYENYENYDAPAADEGPQGSPSGGGGAEDDLPF